MKDRYLYCCGKLTLRPYVPENQQKVKGCLTGDIRRHNVPSKFLGSREVMVYLPPGYSSNDNFRYPLVLLQDGQNIFDAESSVFGVEWGVDEAAEQLIADQKIKPVIMAAIYNSPNRISEYTPFPDPEHGGGEADIYRAFLVEELLPFLAEHYSLTTLAEERAVIGSSLGGLVSLFLGWYGTRTFGKIGALSPSLWWGRRSFITGMAGDATPEIRPQIWLDAGTEESETDLNGNGVPDLIDDLRTLRAVLLCHGYQQGQDLIYREVQGGHHDEASWSARIAEVLTYFFPLETPLRY